MQNRRLFRSLGVRKKSAGNLKSDYYVVGLGNPGGKYAHTRHNAGFDVIEILSQRHGIPVRIYDFQARLGKGKICGKDVLLVQPQTYMNNSGESVKAIMKALGAGTDKLIVVYDDMDLKPDQVRTKERGSAGTHNGIKSVIYHLQTDEFIRIRVGIGKADSDAVDHVLGEYDDKKTAFETLNKAADAVETIIEYGVNKAQNRFN